MSKKMQTQSKALLEPFFPSKIPLANNFKRLKVYDGYCIGF